MVVRAAIFVFLLTVLSGCSPDYNWRDVTLGNGAVKATFPDKPETETRTLSFAGHDIEFALSVAKVNGVVFAIGYGVLPDALRDDAAAREEMGKEVVRSFYQSARTQPAHDVPSWGDTIVIEGQSAKEAITLHAKVWIPRHALIEAAVTSGTANFPSQQADDFLRSVVVAR